MARLVLDASYEACMWVAVERACAHEALAGSKTLVLTVLGGGVFGNPGYIYIYLCERERESVCVCVCVSVCVCMCVCLCL